MANLLGKRELIALLCLVCDLCTVCQGLFALPLCVIWGWLDEANVSCILCHRGVQLILAYSWARSATVAAGEGRRGMLFIRLFIHCHSFSFLPCPSLSSSLLSLLSLSTLSLGDDTK